MTNYMHCTENSKLIFPEMKMRCLVPSFYIHVYGSDLYIPTTGLIWNLYFLYCVRELLAQPREQREGQGTAVKQLVVAVSCPALRSWGWAASSHKMTNIQIYNLENLVHKWKQLILVVNFLFGLRVNEILNKTFLLDSHRPFICSVLVYTGGLSIKTFLGILIRWDDFFRQ